MRAINASVMRAINRKLILNEIRMRPISRAELAEVTHLTRASVTQIIEDLIADGIVMETRIVGRMRLGRRSTQLGISPNAGCFLGVVLGRHRLSAGAIDMSGEVLCRNTISLNGTIDIERCIEDVIDSSKLPRTRILGVGVCASAWLDAGSIAHDVESRTGLHAIAMGHVEARALEEMYFRDAGGSFALLCAGEQLGAAVMTDGRLYRGDEGRAANIGGMAVDADMVEATLGEWLSERALLEGTGCATLEELAGKAEDPRCAKAVRQLVRYASYGAVNLAQLFSVPRVVLAGDAFCHGDAIFDDVAAHVNAHCGDVEIIRGGDFDPVRMAASIVYDDFFAGEPL